MATLKKGPARGGRSKKKGLRGRMPTKTTINLVLVDENKISPLKAIPGIIIIIVLAALFSKFLVADRLVAMTVSSGKVSKLQTSVDNAMKAINEFGDVETTYAHYTMQGMTAAELGMVDRAQVLGLIEKMLPERPSFQKLTSLSRSVSQLYARYRSSQAMTLDYFNGRLLALLREAFPPQYSIISWSVTDNLLTMNVTGNTLRTLNNVARTMEKRNIVDSVAIVTARKDQVLGVVEVVAAQMTVYLQQAEDEPEEDELDMLDAVDGAQSAIESTVGNLAQNAANALENAVSNATGLGGGNAP